MTNQPNKSVYKEQLCSWKIHTTKKMNLSSAIIFLASIGAAFANIAPAPVVNPTAPLKTSNRTSRQQKFLFSEKYKKKSMELIGNWNTYRTTTNSALKENLGQILMNQFRVLDDLQDALNGVRLDGLGKFAVDARLRNTSNVLKNLERLQNAGKTQAAPNIAPKVPKVKSANKVPKVKTAKPAQ